MEDNVHEIHRCCGCNRSNIGATIMVRLRVGILICGDCLLSCCEVVAGLRLHYPQDYLSLKNMINEPPHVAD